MRYFWIMNSRRQEDLETIRSLMEEVASLQEELDAADEKIKNLKAENDKLKKDKK